MKVIIAGSRHFQDTITFLPIVEKLMADLEEGWTITEVVSGCATGIDRIGEEWARWKGVPIKRFAADWDAHGKAAGPIRNRQMAEYADVAVIVWDGKSRGSADMIRQMAALDKAYLHVVYSAGTPA